MFTRVSVWARILLVLLVVAALVLVVCTRYLWSDPRPDPPQEDVALAQAARDYFCAQEAVTTCDAQAGYWNNTGIMTTADLRAETGAEEVITLLTGAEQELADEIAAAAASNVTVALSWKVGGLPLRIENQLGDNKHELARPALTLALTRAGTSARSVTLDRKHVEVDYEKHDTVPEDLDLQIPEDLQAPQSGGSGESSGEATLYYKQTFSSGKRSVELYLEPGQAIDTTPINALLATEERSKYGSTLQAYGGESGLTRISVCELNGDQDHRLTSDEATGLIRAVADCNGLSALELSTGSVASRTSVAAYVCTDSTLAVDREADYDQDLDPVLAQELLDAARA
jgi:hypothetical protein